MLLLKDNACVECPVFVVDGVTILPYCNGVVMLQCFRGHVSQKVVIQIGEGENLTCELCPVGATCNGVDVVRCEPGRKIANSSKSCDACDAGMVCDGSEVMTGCDKIEGASGCKDGVVTGCAKNYKLTEDKARCEINKGQGSCGAGCIVAVFLVIFIVIGVAVAVLLVLYFKRQRAKIDELMFRSVGSVREGRAVDFSNDKLPDSKFQTSGLLHSESGVKITRRG